MYNFYLYNIEIMSHSPTRNSASKTRKTRKSVTITEPTYTCINKRATFRKNPAQYVQYLKNIRTKGSLGCDKNHYPKYENGEYCCIDTHSTKQEELDYVNDLIAAAIRNISDPIFKKFSSHVEYLIRLRKYILERPQTIDEIEREGKLVDNLEIPQLSHAEIKSITKSNEQPELSSNDDMMDFTINNTYIPKRFRNDINVPYKHIEDWYNHSMIKSALLEHHKRYVSNPFKDLGLLRQPPPDIISMSRKPSIKSKRGKIEVSADTPSHPLPPRPPSLTSINGKLALIDSKGHIVSPRPSSKTASRRGGKNKKTQKNRK
jgi:hypothetical protein